MYLLCFPRDVRAEVTERTKVTSLAAAAFKKKAAFLQCIGLFEKLDAARFSNRNK